jgi:hypothetical protein
VRDKEQGAKSSLGEPLQGLDSGELPGMKAKAQQLGLRLHEAEERIHAFVEKVIPTPEVLESSGLRQQCNVFFLGGEMRKSDREDGAAFAQPSATGPSEKPPSAIGSAL